MFQGWFHSDSALTNWLLHAGESGIHAQSLLGLALHFWLQTLLTSANIKLETALLRFSSLIKGIFSLVGKKLGTPHDNYFVYNTS